MADLSSMDPTSDPAKGNLQVGLPELVEKELLRFELVPTLGARDLLMATAILGGSKDDDGHVLSQSGLLYAAVQIVNEKDLSSYDAQDARALQISASHLYSRHPEVFANVATTDFYGSETLPKIGSGTPLSNAEFSRSMVSALGRRKQQGTLTVADLLLDALDMPSSFTKRRLDRLAVDVPFFKEELSQKERLHKKGEKGTEPKKEHDGFGVSFAREASALALDRDHLSLALARLFRVAKGEFSMALLGRWGSGKTTVAEHTTALLKDSKKYQGQFNLIFQAEPEAHELGHKYAVVDFNAWRYRKKPELWIWLYESFVSEYLTCGAFSKVKRTIRVGFEKHGLMQTLFVLLSLAFAAVPLMWMSAAFELGAAIFGATGIVGLVFLVRRLQGSTRQLLDRYGIVASHRQHLGMQALIGEDLSALVRAWTRPTISLDRSIFTLGAVSGLVAVFWGSTFLGSNGGWMFRFFELIAPNLDMMIGSPAITVSFLAYLAWTLVALLFFFSLLWNDGRIDRVVLVVDDLDRCPQEEIIDLIDGVKLLIDDDDIGEIVQAFILADDTVLAAALASRFKTLSNETNDGERQRAAIREHMEKVFLCHLSLPNLDEGDVKKLVDAFGHEFEKPSEPDAPDKNHDPDLSPENSENRAGDGKDAADNRGGATQAQFTPLPPAPNDENGQTIGILPKQPTGIGSIVLSTIEVEVIQTVLKDQFKRDGQVVTPRVVRSFMFKFQLARMLLQSGRTGQAEYEAKALAEHLAAAVSDARQSGKLAGGHEGKNSGLAEVVRLIA